MADDGNYRQVYINLGFPNCFKVSYEFFCLGQSCPWQMMATTGKYALIMPCDSCHATHAM